MENGMNSGVLQYVYYCIVLVIVLVLLLVLVHFTITPIFKLRGGDKGIIPLPGSNDSTTYWKTPSDLKQIKDTATPLGSLVENWSFILDIQLDNPTANTDRPRVLFTRGEEYKASTTPYKDTDTILTINPKFNVCVFLDRLTNDLFVAVQTNNPNTEIPTLETIIVPNIPVGRSITLGVFVGSKVLEVYVNGYLVRSKGFPNQLRSIPGPLQPPLNDILTNTARVSNLRVWARPLSPAEFRSYNTNVSFESKPIQDTCISSTISNLVSDTTTTTSKPSTI
jgi:hypothetical protein